MRRAERLFRVVNEMRTRSVTRAEDLAAHFEISLSTVYRDIAHLQASGLPIEGEAGVGYILRSGFDMPTVTFTYDQIDALAVGLSYVENTGDAVLAAAAREARAKIQASLPAPEQRTLADAPYRYVQGRERETPEIALLRDAIRGRKVVQLRYRTGAGNASERRVQPILVWDMTDAWMFSGWCELRQDFRTFRLDRAQDLTVTGDRFDLDDTKGVQAFLDAES